MIATVGFLIFMFIGLANGTLIPTLIGLALVIGCVVMLKSTKMVDRQVTFDPRFTVVGVLRYPTAEITRFEYGLRSQLTGEKPYNDSKSGAVHSDPTLIRMWLNDSDAVIISTNNWESQVCHKIRDTLAKALDTVRNIEKQETHEAEFGKTGDFGMSEY